ncbi:DNA-binding protein [Cellvibrio sp. OA-2007]|uniref:DNA-binding protein n=1 Tax=Cellvibrio sp. OA-2007 TaxID=529823 RepID=UPI0007814A56|nr:DNA-binding protein [Cellvibrio sp. OA-2007]
MGREATITQEQVNAAADALVAAGQKPTNRAVLDTLGSGSMATVVKFLQNWRAGQSRASAAIDDAIDAEVSRSISNMLARRILDATAEANSKLAELQSDLASVIGENERQAAQIEAQEAELNALRAQAQSQSGQIEQLEVEAVRAREQIASEAKAREAAQVALGKAELRIESLPSLLEELRDARADAKRTGEEAAELRGKLAGMEQAAKSKTK